MELLKDKKDKKNKERKINFLEKLFLKMFLGFLVLMFSILFFLFFRRLLVNKNFPAVIFFDVGQGDSILLRNIGGKNILIDGGPDNLVIKKLGKFLPYFSRHLDLVILSHYHDDHVIGLIETQRRYKIGTLVLSQGAKSGAIQDLLLTLMEAEKNSFLNNNKAKNKTKIIYIDSLAQYNLASCDLFFLNPRFLEIPENDNNSLITKLDCPSSDFLFSGDNELEVEKALFESGGLLNGFEFDLSADVFKASHHGSKTSNSDEFLELISPKVFVISAGLNNRFNHPAQEILERVEKIGLFIKRTDIDGDIVFSIDF